MAVFGHFALDWDKTSDALNGDQRIPVRGMRRLTSAMIVAATRSIAITISTDTPRLTQPCLSGGVAYTIATSARMRPLAINSGICTSEMLTAQSLHDRDCAQRTARVDVKRT
jgi:hypothetical protein